MASPFPGMDPYLENTDLWEGFHNGLIHYVQEDLQPRLPQNYVATLEIRIYFQSEADTRESRTQRIPDPELIRTGPAPVRSPTPAPPAAHGAVLELDPVEIREAYISLKEIPSGRLVTSIEMLSPANKNPGTGRSTYPAKQWQLYGQGVNLVELDFLRGGTHTLLVSSARLARIEPFHYLAGIFRAFDPLKYEVITWTVRDPFPVVPIPLDEGVEEVPLDLGRIFGRTFKTAALQRLLNYAGEPNPPLAAEDAVWADQLLRAAAHR
jgi:hypothetical protein